MLSNHLHPVTREAVEWAYRLVLGRPPENDEVIETHMDVPSVDALRFRFLNSPEVMGDTARNLPAVPAHIISHFPAWRGEVEADSFRDFLGTRTRCAYLPQAYANLAGVVEGYPGTERSPLHDVAEWTGLLVAALEAKGLFVGIELGAGWGPWVVAGAAAAKQRGIPDIKLAAVEGAAGHFAMMHQHFIDNGLDPDKHILLHAAAGTYDGVARFPRLNDPVVEWGAEALYEGTDAIAGVTDQISTDYDEVACISLPTLLSKLPPVDVIHMDIQGSEADVIRNSIDTLNARVRRLVIGTHHRAIEAELLGLLVTAGWVLEIESQCLVTQRGHRFVLLRDGVQVWSNPRTKQ